MRKHAKNYGEKPKCKCDHEIFQNQKKRNDHQIIRASEIKNSDYNDIKYLHFQTVAQPATIEIIKDTIEIIRKIRIKASEDKSLDNKKWKRKKKKLHTELRLPGSPESEYQYFKKLKSLSIRETRLFLAFLPATCCGKLPWSSAKIHPPAGERQEPRAWRSRPLARVACSWRILPVPSHITSPLPRRNRPGGFVQYLSKTAGYICFLKTKEKIIIFVFSSII